MVRGAADHEATTSRPAERACWRFATFKAAGRHVEAVKAGHDIAYHHSRASDGGLGVVAVKMANSAECGGLETVIMANGEHSDQWFRDADQLKDNVAYINQHNQGTAGNVYTSIGGNPTTNNITCSNFEDFWNGTWYEIKCVH